MIDTSRVPPIVWWVLLIAVAVVLTLVVDAAPVESPYNGF